MPKTLLRQWIRLLLDDLQDLHGAGLDADAAGDALGSRSVLVLDDQAEGACLGALAAAGAELLADHVNAGLGVLGDGTVGAGLGAQTALGADLIIMEEEIPMYTEAQKKTLEMISKIGIIPVIAIDDAAKAVPLAKALVAGGLPAAEVTFRTAAAEKLVRGDLVKALQPMEAFFVSEIERQRFSFRCQ